MATRKPESALVGLILKNLNKLPRTKAIKLHLSGMNNAGEPDIFGCSDGKFFVLEVKRPNLGKRSQPTALQAIKLEEWKQACGSANCVRSWEETVQVLQEDGILPG